MSKCINKSHPEFKQLLLDTEVNPFIVAAKVGIWMEQNNTELFPTIDQLSIKKGPDTSILYQAGPSRGRAVIQEARDIFFNEVYQRDLSETDVRRINTKLKQISDRIGDQLWRLDF